MMFLTTHIDPMAALSRRSLLPSLDGLRSPKPRSCRATGLQLLLPAPPPTSMIESPMLWAGRVCVYYALLKAGLAGFLSNPLTCSADAAFGESGFAEWLENSQRRSEDKKAVAKRKLVSKKHPTTKGTLKRSYRVPSKAVGIKLLKGIDSLLSDDDHFRDATSHKQAETQIKRRMGIGSHMSERRLIDELARMGMNESIVRRALIIMHQRDEVEYKRERRIIVRKS